MTLDFVACPSGMQGMFSMLKNHRKQCPLYKIKTVTWFLEYYKSLGRN